MRSHADVESRGASRPGVRPAEPGIAGGIYGLRGGRLRRLPGGGAHARRPGDEARVRGWPGVRRRERISNKLKWECHQSIKNIQATHLPLPACSWSDHRINRKFGILGLQHVLESTPFIILIHVHFAVVAAWRKVAAVGNLAGDDIETYAMLRIVLGDGVIPGAEPGYTIAAGRHDKNIQMNTYIHVLNFDSRCAVIVSRLDVERVERIQGIDYHCRDALTRLGRASCRERV